MRDPETWAAERAAGVDDDECPNCGADVAPSLTCECGWGEDPTDEDWRDDR